MASKFPSSTKQLLAATAAIAAIAGGLAGGMLGVVAAGVAGDNIWPVISRSLGIGSGGILQLGGLPARQAVVEDSAAIDVVAQATRSVVSIVVTQDLSRLYSQTGPFAPFGFQPPSGVQRLGGGTGFVVTTDGMIVTNRHVVDNAAADYTVIMNDGSRHEAEVLARDTLNDIAILKIQADNLPVLDFGDSDRINIGQTVIAIGNSLGEYSNTVTKGVVSGINRRVVAGDSTGFSEVIDGAIQTDAAINPGNSGGPLLDLFGNVIGVNTAVSRQGQLIGFAIPSNAVESVIQSVRDHGRIVRPFLGVRYILLSPELASSAGITGVAHGALIVAGELRSEYAVIPGSPADEAGLEENDIILSVNGEAVTQDRSLGRILSGYAPGDTVTLFVRRGTEEFSLRPTLREQQ
ncbi:MAG: trypsin-like peptidase domain-containing protein [Patescibacteria group bacterium]|nr:trypsin-like peptidase domain-containing protein [Patescibacteria group bacterium]